MLPVAVQVTRISIKPVLHHEQFTLYNDFVTNVISLGSYHLDGDVMRIFFGEPYSLLKHSPVWLMPTISHSDGPKLAVVVTGLRNRQRLCTACR